MAEQHLEQWNLLLRPERSRWDVGFAEARKDNQGLPVIPEGLISWRDKLAAEKHCRACLRPHAVRPLTRHHLVPQHWWKRRGARFARYRNIAANVIPLCRVCHDEVERDTEARRMLRRVLAQDEIALAIALRGKAWLDAAYPR